MTELTLDGVTKVYSDSRGRETAVEDVSLTVNDGEFIVIVGPSGCGKSTTLRMIAGLETVTEGSILFDDEEVHEYTPPRRNVAMVFQNYSLYPSMDARENMEYGLKHSTDLSKEARLREVDEAAKMLDIEDILDQNTDEMSGGQKQRVALGRAIVREPRVFLLDEPLSNLDAKLRSEMRHEIQRIHKELDVTTIYVTHDQKEAMTMADRIAILSDGKLQQVETPERLYNAPENRFVAQFIGSPSMNLLDVTTERSRPNVTFYHGGQEIATVPESALNRIPSEVELGIRPEHMGLTETPTDSSVPVEVLVPEYQGKTNFIHVDLAGNELTARTKPGLLPDTGTTAHLDLDPDDLYVFDAETGDAEKTRQATEHASVERSPTDGVP